MLFSFNSLYEFEQLSFRLSRFQRQKLPLKMNENRLNINTEIPITFKILFLFFEKFLQSSMYLFSFLFIIN